MAKKSDAKSQTPERTKRVTEITGLAQFVGIVVDYFHNNKVWMFRGQRDVAKALQPKAGREPYFIEGKDKDLTRFNKWCHQAVAFSTDLPSEPFERLAYAQHYGLATRLLDWTLNAVAALYFATELDCETKDRPGAVFFFRRPRSEINANHKIDKCKVVKFYQPRPIAQRIIAQDSIFTFHPDPKKEMRWKWLKLRKGKSGRLEPDGNLLAVSVPARRKLALQGELRTIGVHRRSLFPDIEGLSALINTTHELYNDSRQPAVNRKAKRPSRES